MSALILARVHSPCFSFYALDLFRGYDADGSGYLDLKRWSS